MGIYDNSLNRLGTMDVEVKANAPTLMDELKYLMDTVSDLNEILGATKRILIGPEICDADKCVKDDYDPSVLNLVQLIRSNLEQARNTAQAIRWSVGN